MQPHPQARPAPVPVAACGEHWARALACRWRHRQWLKVLGICAFLALFFQGYFFVLRHPSQEVTVMPLTPLDHWIGFEPAAFWVYVSLWVYVGIAPALLPSLRALVGYGAWAGALCATGLLLFWWWPTAVPAPDAVLDAALTAHAGLALLRGVDAVGNACPSLHVATAVFTALWLHRQLAEVRAPRATHAANLAWLALIAWSTVAVRQHVVLDVVAGAALGAAFGLLALRFGPAPAMPPRAQRLS